MVCATLVIYSFIQYVFLMTALLILVLFQVSLYQIVYAVSGKFFRIIILKFLDNIECPY